MVMPFLFKKVIFPFFLTIEKVVVFLSLIFYPFVRLSKVWTSQKRKIKGGSSSDMVFCLANYTSGSRNSGKLCQSEEVGFSWTLFASMTFSLKAVTGDSVQTKAVHLKCKHLSIGTPR